jgi:hypothetical protein
VALHPLQEEDDDDVLTVWPPASLETKPQADINLLTLFPSQVGHPGVSEPKTKASNSCPQFWHWYS